jgi:hypothetical protein
MTTMNNRKITSLKKLRKEKALLLAQMETEKSEIVASVAHVGDALWPLQVIRRFRHTAESLSENRLVVVGVQLAHAVINAVRERNEVKDGAERKTSILYFIEEVAKNFLNKYTKDQEAE